MEENSAYSNYKEVIARAAGPSPWYLLSSGPKLKSRYGDLTWKQAGETGFLVGKVLLATPEDKALAVFQMHCHVQALDQTHFLVWLPEEVSDDNIPVIKLLIFNADELEVIPDIESACQKMNENNTRVSYLNGKTSCLSISRELDDGKHEVVFPAQFKDLGELLMLAHSTAGGKTSNFTDQMNLALYVIIPEQNTVTVIPQDWFNKGRFDFGYQWPTRVARDPLTGKIFGEGIHLGFYVLDDSGREIEMWLNRDSSHQA